LIPAVFVSESSNQSLGHSNSISQFRNLCVAALESDADILEVLSRFVRDVATSALHDDATCVNGVRFKISSLSYADRITIADCKKVVARTEVAEIDRTSVAPSRIASPIFDARPVYTKFRTRPLLYKGTSLILYYANQPQCH